jgi:hypothetical protein
MYKWILILNQYSVRLQITLVIMVFFTFVQIQVRLHASLVCRLETHASLHSAFSTHTNPSANKVSLSLSTCSKSSRWLRAESCASARRRSLLGKPFLRTKCTAGIGKWCREIKLCNAYANRILVFAEGLDMFRLRPIATRGRMIPSGSVLCEKNFG